MSSIREQIISQIVTTLEGASVAGGYNNDLSGSVFRRLIAPDECFEFPRVMISGGTERKKSLTTVMTESILEVVVRGYEHDAEDPGEKLNDLIQDVEKGLMVDPTRGGLAAYTEPIELMTDEGMLTPHGIMEFRFEVTYTYPRGTP